MCVVESIWRHFHPNRDNGGSTENRRKEAKRTSREKSRKAKEEET